MIPTSPAIQVLLVQPGRLRQLHRHQWAGNPTPDSLLPLWSLGGALIKASERYSVVWELRAQNLESDELTLLLTHCMTLGRVTWSLWISVSAGVNDNALKRLLCGLNEITNAKHSARYNKYELWFLPSLLSSLFPFFSFESWNQFHFSLSWFHKTDSTISLIWSCRRDTKPIPPRDGTLGKL